MLRVVLILAFTALTASPAWALPVGIDDFEDGTTAGWHVGNPDSHPTPPANVPTGGPAGVDDAYLQDPGSGRKRPRQPPVRPESLAVDRRFHKSWRPSGWSSTISARTELVLRLLFVNFPDAPEPQTDVAWTLAPVVVPSRQRLEHGWI